MREPKLSFGMLKEPNAKAFIYAIQSGEFIKVGMTTNPVKRVKALMLHNPHPLSVVMYRTVSKHYVRSIEKHMHELLAQWHHSGEWFTAPLVEIRKAAKIAIGEATRLQRIEKRMQIAVRQAALEAESRGLDVEKEIAKALRLARQGLQP